MNTSVSRAARQVVSQRSVNIHVAELQLGMFVSDLDRGWLETPFVTQGFIIETEEHLALLREYCDTVWVDKVFSKWIKAETQAVFESPAHLSMIYQVPAQDEHENASNIYQKARQITKTLMDEV
ncbi:MAG: DUF3391 domain-containing protein, partial [Pseudomonadales bacterium]|nr:DUF3391 domain-containing protein [Pseudomonadales bacterium]